MDSSKMPTCALHDCTGTWLPPLLHCWVHEDALTGVELASRKLVLKTFCQLVTADLDRMRMSKDSTAIASRPQNTLSQAYDTAIAICREMAYPQLYWLTGSFTRYFNPPALGRCLLLLAYWG